MKTFFCKLIAPRPSFAADMTADEAQLMQQHGVYWRERLDAGEVVTFGVVADPKGAFGIGVVEVQGDPEVQALTTNDPVIRANRGFSWETYLMPRGAVHK